MLLQAGGEPRRFSPFQAAAESLQAKALDGPGAAITACTLYTDSGGWLSHAVSPGSEAEERPRQQCGPQSFCAVVRASGMLEVFALPSWEPVFYNSGLTQVSAAASRALAKRTQTPQTAEWGKKIFLSEQ